MRCDQKPYVPKKNLIDPLQIRKMLGRFIDPYDYGVDLGKKQIIHCNTLEKLNLIFSPVLLPSSPNPTESDWAFFRKNLYHQNKRQYQVRLSRNVIASHMTQQKTYYYTSNPFSPYMLMGFDVDNHTSDPQQIKPFLELFESHFPSFYDRGSSKKSLHYFPKINMLPLYEHYIELCLENNTTLSWSKYTNDIIHKISYIIRLYGHHLLAPECERIMKESGQCKPKYSVEFDAIKGTYPDYSYKSYRDKSGKINYKITGIINCGTLVKLPNLYSEQDVMAFINSPVYSILDLLMFCIYLSNQIILGCTSDNNNSVDNNFSDSSRFIHYSDYKKLLTMTEDIEDILKAHSISFPSLPQEKNVVTSSITTEVLYNRDVNKYYVYMTGHFDSYDNFDNNREDLSSIQLESDAFKRSRRYLYYIYREFIICGKELRFEDYRNCYRHDVGTDEETQDDLMRLQYVWDKYQDKMKQYQFVTIQDKIDYLEKEISKIASINFITDIQNQHSSYKRKIYLKDVAAAALWISVTLTHPEYLDRKRWTAKHNNINHNRELTAPMRSLELFMQMLKDKEIIKNACDHKKAKALRIILTQLGWIECIDDTYDYGSAHRSMRYILTDKHPYYVKFVDVIGTSVINAWKDRFGTKHSIVA